MIETTEVYGGMIIRNHIILAGEDLISHVHPYDHMSILWSGEVLLDTNGEVTKLVGPTMVRIAAKIAHKVHAITDCKWDCLHAFDYAEEARIEGDPHVMRGLE